MGDLGLFKLGMWCKRGKYLQGAIMSCKRMDWEQFIAV